MATGYSRTGDGLELQMATNHFGPFLLTGLLLPQLAAAPAGRVVTVSSLMHRIGALGAAGRPAAPSAGATGAGRRTAARSWPTCSSPTSSTAGPAAPGWP